MSTYPKTATPSRVWGVQVGVTADPDLFDLWVETRSVTTEGVYTADIMYPALTATDIPLYLGFATIAADAGMVALGFAIVGATI